MNTISDNYITYINHKFISAFTLDSNTGYKCPYCHKNSLKCNENDTFIEETLESKQERNEEDWEPDWAKYTFTSTLSCISCNEKTFCIGVGKREFHSYCGPDEDAPENIKDCYEMELTPTYFEPSIPIFTIPSKCPKNIKNEAQHAFKLAFSDFSASGNRVRTCLELYILQLNANATGTLHHKIESIKGVDATAYEILMAIKWLGNQGSHESSLQEYDLAFAFEALEFCLNKTYNSNEFKLKTLASLINANKESIVKT